MQDRDRQPIDIRRGLTGDEQEAAARIVEEANLAEGLDLPIAFGAEFAPDGTATALPRQYGAYSGERLFGVASVQPGDEPEVLVVVHPDARRRGVGSALLDALREDYQSATSLLLLTTDERSAAGRAFMGAVGATFRFAEYAMVLEPGAVDRSRSRIEGLALKPARDEDTEALVRATAAAFGDPEQATREFLLPLLQAGNRRFWLITLADVPIGGIAIVWSEDSAGITTFGIVPEYRGRGLGRQALVDLIDMLLAEGWREITIEVAVENRNALGLYHACGFRETTTFGYYELEQ